MLQKEFELLSKIIEGDDCLYINPKYRLAFQLGGLNVLSIIKDELIINNRKECEN